MTHGIPLTAWEMGLSPARQSYLAKAKRKLSELNFCVGMKAGFDRIQSVLESYKEDLEKRS